MVKDTVFSRSSVIDIEARMTSYFSSRSPGIKASPVLLDERAVGVHLFTQRPTDIDVESLQAFPRRRSN